MKIHVSYPGNYFEPEKVAKLNATIEQLMSGPNYGYLLPNGWRAIVRIDLPVAHNNWEMDNLILDVQADEGGGSFAKVKMDTLEQYPKMIATGLLEFKDLSDLVLAAVQSNRIAREDMGIAADLIRYTDGTALSRMQHEWLRDKLDITNFMGGVRLSIYGQESVLDSDDESFRKKGEIRVAVSGATEWQDTYLALVIAQWTLNTFHYEIVPESREKLLSIPSLCFLYRLIPEPMIIVVP